MPFELLEEIAIADACYKLTGTTLEELFESGFLALMDCVADLKTVEANKELSIEIKDKPVDKLLYEFLEELVFLIDTESIVYNSCQLQIISREKNDLYSLHAVLKGENIDYDKHEMRTDVKAVTYYQFYVKKIENRWEARVTFDL
ncbi:MAG: archease [Candidatus Odinarchaeota archaeon]